MNTFTLRNYIRSQRVHFSYDLILHNPKNNDTDSVNYSFKSLIFPLTQRNKDKINLLQKEHLILPPISKTSRLKPILKQISNKKTKLGMTISKSQPFIASKTSKTIYKKNKIKNDIKKINLSYLTRDLPPKKKQSNKKIKKIPINITISQSNVYFTNTLRNEESRDKIVFKLKK